MIAERAVPDEELDAEYWPAQRLAARNDASPLPGNRGIYARYGKRLFDVVGEYLEERR